MKTLRTVLADADPIRGSHQDTELSAADAVAMRRRVLNAIAVPAPALFWPRGAAVAAVVVLTIVLGAAAGRRLAERPDTTLRAVSNPEPQERRQVHFSTPGGTRIIWTIDPHFRLGDTTP